MLRIYLAWFFLSMAAVAGAETLTASQILERSYLANRLPDTSAQVRMVLRNESGKERIRELQVFSQLQGAGPDARYALFFRSPADIKNTATLLVQHSGAEDDMWVYLPGLRKTRRLFSDNKRDAFMGSDVSYGDILGHRPADWVATLGKEELFNGVPIYVIEAKPANDNIKSSSGYSLRTLWIDKASFLPLKTEFLDDAGQKLKTVVVSEIKPLGNSGKYQFMRLEATQHQTGNHTTLLYQDFRFNTGLKDEIFTQRALERGID